MLDLDQFEMDNVSAMRLCLRVVSLMIMLMILGTMVQGVREVLASINPGHRTSSAFDWRRAARRVSDRFQNGASHEDRY